MLQTEFVRFTANDAWVPIIDKAVAYHSDYRLPDDLSDRERLFCTITCDADDVDILRVLDQSSFRTMLGLEPDEFQLVCISHEAYAGLGARHERSST